MLGGLVAVDETAFLQMMISRPLVAGTLVGWVFGDLTNGLLLGSVLELIYLDVLPIGAVHFPDSGLATVVGTGTLVLSGKFIVEPSPTVWLVVILISLLTGFIGGLSISFLRRRNHFLLEKAEEYLAAKKLWAVDFFNVLGVFFSFTRGVVLTLIFTSLFLVVVGWVGENFTSVTDFQLLVGRNLIVCASLALGVRLFVNGKTFVFFALGVGLTLTFLGFGY